MRGRRLATVVALAALGGSAAAVVVAHNAAVPLRTPSAPSRSIPVTRADLGCPARPEHGAAPRLFAVAPPRSTPAAAGSRISVGTVAAGAGEKSAQQGVGTPLDQSLPSAAGPASAGIEVRGTDGAAPGLTAAEWSTYDAPSASGFAAGWCRRPGTSWWFAGVDTGVGTQTILSLLNLSPSTAVVDVSVFGPHGPVEVPGGRGLAVGPRSQLGIDLAKFAPGRPVLAVHVQVTSGRVVAAISTTRLSALTPTGADWVPSTARPAARLVVAAGDPNATSQQLVVANPTDRQVLVHVRFVSATGTFTSTKVADVSLPPGGVASKSISTAVGRAATGVEVTASRPIVAASVSEAATPARDFSVSVAAPALGDEAVAPVPLVASARLVLSSAERADTVVRLTSIDSSGRVLARTQLTVKGQRTANWRPVNGRTAYVVISEPAGSDLHGSVILSSSAGVATLPLLPGVWRQTLRGVVPAPVG